VDRHGKELEHIAAGDELVAPELSPDSRMAAGIMVPGGASADIWLIDLAAGTKSRFTFDPKGELSPVWSPDGKRIAYVWEQRTGYDIYIKSVAGVGKPELLFSAPGNRTVSDWSRDGRWLLFFDSPYSQSSSVFAVPVEGNHKAVPLVSSAFLNAWATFSPDGRFVAYVSNESGRLELYVQTFQPGSPGGGGKWQISTGGSAFSPARWRRDGRELFYQSVDRKLMAVPVQTGSDVRAGKPEVLFEKVSGGWDAHPDGQRFLVLRRSGAQPTEPLQVVLNWTATLPNRK
jgi:Tol biopolymer transport system component